MFGDPTAIDWEMDTGSGTVAEYLVNNARDLAAFNQVIRNQCAERNITMTAEEEAELDQQMADAVENSGGQDNFELSAVQKFTHGKIPFPKKACRCVRLKGEAHRNPVRLSRLPP